MLEDYEGKTLLARRMDKLLHGRIPLNPARLNPADYICIDNQIARENSEGKYREDCIF